MNILKSLGVRMYNLKDWGLKCMWPKFEGGKLKFFSFLF